MVLDCLESVAQIKYDNLHLVVIDNGSQDGTAAVLRREWGERITLIANTENLRFSRGNNEGIRYAMDQQADYLMLLNDDIKVDADIIAELVAVAEADASIGIVGPKIYYFQPADQIWFAGGDVHLAKGTCSHRGIREIDHGQYDAVSDCDYITGCALMIKRSVVAKIGMLDPAYLAYYEDTDWCWRAKLAGYRCVYVPRAKMWHKISASTGGQVTRYKIRHKLRSGFIFFRRYARFHHGLTIPFFFVMDTLRILALLMRGKIRRG
jgi:GT2 family glycosyltransferase